MAGMLTGDRMVRLEIAGVCQQSISHTSNYSITVPYRSMSQTMQNISRMGGKVVGVHVSDTQAAAAPTAAAPAPAAEEKSSNKKGKRK
jgi:hypothetical protein